MESIIILLISILLNNLLINYNLNEIIKILERNKNE